MMEEKVTRGIVCYCEEIYNALMYSKEANVLSVRRENN